MRGWSVVRRLAGFVTAGAVIGGTVVAARQDPDAAATAVEPAPVTAWLPAPGLSVVLGDARHVTPVHKATIPAENAAVTQFGDLAIAVAASQVTVLDGSGPRRTHDGPLPGPMFVAASTPAAWVLSPEATWPTGSTGMSRSA